MKKNFVTSLATYRLLAQNSIHLQEKNQSIRETAMDSMTNNLLDFDTPVDISNHIIKVIGVGGGGCNAVRNMYSVGIQGVSFAVCNTDSKPLLKSPVPVKIQLGEGLGAGGDPNIGKEEAQKNLDDIKRLLDDGTQMVFVTAGMGGGTGTGSAPVIAAVAKEKGILTVGVVTLPFYFEKKKKIIKALKGIEELKKHVDALLIVNNERLCQIYSDSKVPMNEAFARADNILKDAVQGISELITVYSDGCIGLDFRDVETTIRNGGGAIMAMGRANGEMRIERAIIDALDSPLLCGNNIGKAKRILFNIYASEKAPIYVSEMQEIDEFFDQLDPDIDVIWGTSIDNTLGEDVKVTILATGLEDGLSVGEDNIYNRTDNDKHYDELIKKLYKPGQASKNTPLSAFINRGKGSDTEVKDEPEASTVQTNEDKTTDNTVATVIEDNASTNDNTNETDIEDETPEPTPAQESQEEEPILMKWKKWVFGKVNDILNEPDL